MPAATLIACNIFWLNTFAFTHLLDLNRYNQEYHSACCYSDIKSNRQIDVLPDDGTWWNVKGSFALLKFVSRCKINISGTNLKVPHHNYFQIFILHPSLQWNSLTQLITHKNSTSPKKTPAHLAPRNMILLYNILYRPIILLGKVNLE